ncbi:hypothetical protein [Roseicyclus elongatus]|uniref:hypothetical protein n=1 Tax=Roseicyclus elongatus TaxID=159346 RepID=UPI0012EC23F3|nr:hypothetical protein [Roseibacterium elongatum]
MTRVAGHEVAARLKEVDAGWHDRAAMADLRARRAEMQRDAGYRDFDNVYSLDGARMRSAVG